MTGDVLQTALVVGRCRDDAGRHLRELVRVGALFVGQKALHQQAQRVSAVDLLVEEVEQRLRRRL